MKKYKLKTKAISTTTKKVWMGIDAHKKTLHITILDDEGERIFTGSLPYGREHVVGLIKRLEDVEITAVYEAGPTGYQLLHWLRELGCNAFMCPPTHVRKLRGGTRIKTDERDSYTLAEQARAKMLPAVHSHEKKVYGQRQISRTRGQLVKHRSQAKAQIKSLLLYHGVRPPKDLKANWSKAYLQWLAEGPTNDGNLNLSIEALLQLIKSLSRQIKRLEARLKALQKEERWADQAERLRGIPGIGAITAMLLLVELGDVSRFDRCEEFASWLGLVPCEWSSGEGQHRGSITRAGNKRVRTALVEASWILVGKDKAMKKVYERIKKRRGASIAIVAVARRLALIIRAMLRDEKPYQYQSAAA